MQRVRAVGQDRRDGVAGLEAEAAQRVHHLVGAGEHVTGGVLGAVGLDDREVARVFLRVVPEATHAAFPSSGSCRGAATGFRR